jgi:hypothetical protein
VVLDVEMSKIRKSGCEVFKLLLKAFKGGAGDPQND